MAKNSINPGVRLTYLFGRYTTRLVLAATMELSESQYNTSWTKTLNSKSETMSNSQNKNVQNESRRMGPDVPGPVLQLWIPAFAGMTVGGRADGWGGFRRRSESPPNRAEHA